jgi:hypothetical protein
MLIAKRKLINNNVSEAGMQAALRGSAVDLLAKRRSSP